MFWFHHEHKGGMQCRIVDREEILEIVVKIWEYVFFVWEIEFVLEFLGFTHCKDVDPCCRLCRVICPIP